jgi:hypothetical protein
MTRVLSEWSTVVREMLAQERQIPAVPAATRDRAFARALETVTTMALSPPIEPTPPRSLRWAAIVAVLGLGSTAGGVAGYRLGARVQAVPTRAVVAARMPESVADGKTRDTASADARLEASSSSPLSRRAGLPADGEVRLLEKAWVALEREEFAAALVAIVEHARRFRNGRLMEEREALRVKALSGLGLRDEVRRAAAEFEGRFPRSPLLPAVTRMASSS